VTSADFGFIALKTLNYLDFDFERTWWRLFQKRAVRAKFDVYVFIFIIHLYIKSKIQMENWVETKTCMSSIANIMLMLFDIYKKRYLSCREHGPTHTYYPLRSTTMVFLSPNQPPENMLFGSSADRFTGTNTQNSIMKDAAHKYRTIFLSTTIILLRVEFWIPLPILRSP
jgi:hypothetical protein